MIGHFLNFLGAVGNDLKEQKSVFFSVKRVYVGLIMLAAG